MFSLLYHLYGFTHSSVALTIFNTYVSQQDSYLWRCLTFFNLVLQVFYFAQGLFIDLMCSLTPHNCAELKNFRDFIYASIVFPLCLFIFFNFWMIFELDDQLIEPHNTLEQQIPMWCSHVFHTLILIPIFEGHLTPIIYPRRRQGLLMNVTFGLLYLSYLLWLRFSYGYWGYEFLNILNTSAKCCYFIFQLFAFAGWYLFGELVNSLHGHKLKQSLVYDNVQTSIFEMAGSSSRKVL